MKRRRRCLPARRGVRWQTVAPRLAPFGVLLCLLSLAGCVIVRPDDGRVAILFFNVANLFDEHRDGNEYSEFTPEAGWDAQDVRRRLAALGGVLVDIDPPPDVLVLCEVEHRAILDRLLDEHLVDAAYRWRAFARAPGGANGIAVASRYPITRVRTMLPRADLAPPVRPVLEVEIDVEGLPLVIFGNHWKSRLGDRAASRATRLATARLLNSRLRELSLTRPEVPLIVGGDFNDEPVPLGTPADDGASIVRIDSAVSPHSLGTVHGLLVAPNAPLARHAEPHVGGGPLLVDLWAESDEVGSYWYGGRWERIDAIYASHSLFDGSGLEVERFAVPIPDGFLDEEGIPRTMRQAGDVVSDHLPVMVVIGVR